MIDFNTAIQLNPEYAKAYHNRGFLYHQIGELEKAIEDYDKAIELYSDYALAYYSRGMASLCLEELGKAKLDLAIAKDKGWNIVTEFRDDYRSIGDFEQQTGIQIPINIATMLTEQ